MTEILTAAQPDGAGSLSGREIKTVGQRLWNDLCPFFVQRYFIHCRQDRVRFLCPPRPQILGIMLKRSVFFIKYLDNKTKSVHCILRMSLIFATMKRNRSVSAGRDGKEGHSVRTGRKREGHSVQKAGKRADKSGEGSGRGTLKEEQIWTEKVSGITQK